MTEWIIFLLIGVFAGTSAGLFGLGGGVIVVPALIMVYHTGFASDEFITHLAVGTSLMTITVTSLSSAYAHYRYRHIDWAVFFRLMPALLLGGFLGAYIAILFSSSVLQQCFATFLLLSAIKIWLPTSNFSSSNLVKTGPIAVFGVIAGSVSALVGIGGGSLIVPYLVSAKLTIKQAIGTSSACGFPIALAGVIGFLTLANGVSIQETGWQTGYIDWKAFIGIVSTSIVFARVGASLAKRLPVVILQRIFSLLLIILGIKMWLDTV